MKIVIKTLFLAFLVNFSLIGQTVPIVEGDLYSCSGGGESTYRIANFESGWTITWMVSGGGTVVSQTNSEAVISWNGIQGITYQVIAIRTDMGGNGIMGTLSVYSGTRISLICRGHLNVSLEADCTIDLSSELFLISSAFEAPLLNVKVKDQFGRVIDEITSAHIGKTLTVSIEEPTSCGTNSCWTTITVEDKIALELICPPDTTIRCDLDVSPAVAGMPIVNDCQDYTLTFQDFIKDGGCNGDTLFRTFRATDAKGVSTSCTQTIFLEPLDLDDLTLPDNFTCVNGVQDGVNCSPIEYDYGVANATDAISCDELGSVYNVLPNGNPSPEPLYDDKGKLILLGTGVPGGAFSCGTFNTVYEDKRIDICNEDGCKNAIPSFKVIRTWTILEWCTGTLLEHGQIIKVIDDEAPVFTPLPDVTISTGFWTCDATYPLPKGVATDNCSEDIFVSYGSSRGTITNNVLYLPSVAKTMPGEEIEIYVSYSDCCGNIAVDTFLVTIADLVPPVAVADEHTVVSLSEYNSQGLAKIYATTFDDGSFDNCGPVELSVRRMDTTCPGYEQEDGDIASTSGFDDLWFDYVHFCCEDIKYDADGNLIPVMVVFRVCDDANMDGFFGEKGEDLCNTVMVAVEVQDKLAPACSLPQDMTINCIDFVAYQDLINIGVLNAVDAAKIDDIFGKALGAATCNVELKQELTSSEDCGIGTISRKLIATNLSNGRSTTCTQTIRIVADEDANFLTCDDISFPEDSEEYIIFRNYIRSKYTASNPAFPDKVWCLMNPVNIGYNVTNGEDLPPIVVEDCAEVSITSPIINIDNLCSEVGINLTLDTFNFAGGGCRKILAHWEIIDQCLFVENYLYYNNGSPQINPFVAENGYFELYVEYDLFDTEGPEITCGVSENVGCEGTLNNSIFATATDNCTDPEFFGWSWKLDVNDNGTFDFTGEGSSISPSNLGLTAFPAGDHSVTWIVSDGCGNITSKECVFNLELTDNKPPTPYCYNGLSSAIMLENGVTMWASDFDAGSFDNCSDVFVSMVPQVDVEGLSDIQAYLKSLNRVTNPATGKLEYGWMFDCSYIENGISHTIEVRIYATDESGNYDYCVSGFTLRDNLNACEDTGGAFIAVGGAISTEAGDMVDGVTVEAYTNNPEYPKYSMTKNGGQYAFNDLYPELAYVITSQKNNDYLNGVSTLDLVMIQRHIIQISPLTSPYKMIAADINNDKKVTAADLLQLRKLILGIYPGDVLPNNYSWRFVDADFNFINGSAWPFKEKINVNNPTSDMMTGDFVGVKVGDVNGTVVVNANTDAQVRTANTLMMEVSDQSYQRGEKLAVTLNAKDFKKIFGYQFTLEFGQNLNFVKFESGALNLDESNFGFQKLNEGVITTSFDDAYGSTIADDEALFTLHFIAADNGSLYNDILISSKVTKAEAYMNEALEISNVELQFRGNEGLVGNQFKLFQNEPNPFSNQTTIGFELPEAGKATLSIYNVDGKLLLENSGQFIKGKNTININAGELGTTGVLYYKLTYNGDQFLTQKMVIIH